MDFVTYTLNLLIETTSLTKLAFDEIASDCRELKGEIGIDGFEHFDKNAFAL